MQIGELSEAVQKRSVLRPLHMEIGGAGGRYGADAVAVPGPDCGERSVCALAGPLPGYSDRPEYQVTAAANALAACRARPGLLLVQGQLPPGCEEQQLQEDMRRIAQEAERQEMTPGQAQLQVSPQVLSPQYFITAVGKAAAGSDPVLEPGQELVLTKWIGLAGTAALVRHHREALSRRFPFRLLDQAGAFDRWMSVRQEAELAGAGAGVMHCLSHGGILTALWEMAERGGVGLEVDLRRIPVKQETIELCEYFDLNPYGLFSEGALLIGTAKAQALVAELSQRGIPAAVIGRAVQGRERVLQNGEDRRYLDRPRQDEWWRRMEL